MKPKKTIFAILMFFTCLFVNAQIDAIKLTSAIKAFKNNEFQLTLDALSEVSSSGRKSRVFVYYKGYAHYNLLEYDSADVYLKRYLLFDMENEEVAETLGDIDYQKKIIEQKEQDRINKLKQEEEDRQKKITKAEELAWNKAQSENSISSYQRYLNGNTIKTHSKEATDLIEMIKYSEDESAWKTAKTDHSIDSYEIYINGTTIKNHLNEAINIHKNALIYWGEKSAFVNDLIQMENYFDKYFSLYPNGTDIGKAKKIMCEAYLRNGMLELKIRSHESQKKAITYFNKVKNICPGEMEVNKPLEKAKRREVRYGRPDRFHYVYCYDAISTIGLSFGAINTQKIGAYFTPRFNFNVFTNDTYYTVNNAGKTSGSVFTDIRYTNTSRKGNCELMIGATKKVFHPLWMYIGSGLSYNPTYWEMDTYDDYGIYYDTRWVKNTDETKWKPVFESGFILNIKGFILKGGVKTQEFRNFYGSFGIGFSLIR